MKKIHLFFENTILKNKTNILKSIFGFIGILLVLLLSGAGYTSFGMSGKGKIILYGLSFLYFGSLYVLRVKTSIFKESFEKKKLPVPPLLFMAVVTILFFALLSFIFNKNKGENINTYIAFVLMIVLSFFILTTFKADYVLKLFKNTIFVLSIIAIFIFILTNISESFFPAMYFAGGRAIYGTHIFVTNDTISGLTNSYHFELRLTSLFWEPSVLGTMIIFALIAEIYTKKDRLMFLRIAVLIIAGILSKSTTVFVLAPVVLFVFLSEKSTNIYLKATAVFVFVAIVLLCGIFQKPLISALADKFPEIFGKLESNRTASFITRLQSFGKCMEVFAKNPVFGFGGVTARKEYFAVSGWFIDAETSTFGSSMAAFGFAGVFYTLSILIGFILCKKIDSFSKIVLVILVALLSNIQNQGEILIANVFYLMPLALTALPKKCEEYNKTTFPNSYNSTKTVKDFILRKNDSGEISRNVIGSLVLKGVAIIIAFFTIPVCLKYFNNNNSTYGIWVAITSILSVITVFDFGMGNGLKNKLIKNINDKNHELSKTQISTTYLITAIVGLLVFVTFTTVIFTLSDQTLLKVFYNGQDPANIDLLSFRIGVSIILLAIGCQFFMKNINYVLQAHQKNAVTGVFMVITNGCLMLFALIFANVIPTEYKIVSLASAYLFFLVTPLLLASIILYAKKYRAIAPSIKSIDFNKSKSTINTGFKFFAVQIGNLFLWSLNEFIILFAFNYQSALVTEYVEYYKLFSLLPIILGTVIQQPLWTAIAKAEAEGDKNKIKKYFGFLLICTVGVVIINLILSGALSLVFDIWLGSSAPEITSTKLAAFIVYSVIYTIALMFVIIMNALSLFRLQIITAIMAVAIKIPFVVLLIYVAKANIGWEIVIFANCICYLPIFALGAFEIISYLKKKDLLWGRKNEKA